MSSERHTLIQMSHKNAARDVRRKDWYHNPLEMYDKAETFGLMKSLSLLANDAGCMWTSHEFLKHPQLGG
jgi:hypothetical protein